MGKIWGTELRLAVKPVEPTAANGLVRRQPILAMIENPAWSYLALISEPAAVSTLEAKSPLALEKAMLLIGQRSRSLSR